MVRERLQQYSNSTIGVALHVIAQIVVLCGLPVFAYFANAVLDATTRLAVIETRMDDSVERRLQELHDDVDSLRSQASGIDKKLDVLIDRKL